MEEVKQTLRENFQIVTKLFYEHCIVLNSGKCHFICFGKNTECETDSFNKTEMENSSEEKILGIITENKLSSKVM